MGQGSKVKLLQLFLFFLVLIASNSLRSQYTEVINSNRPGLSVSAYAVGKNVIQAEFGIYYEQQDHSDLLWNSDIIGGELALRYGLLFEQLEIIWEGSYQNQNINYTALNFEDSRTDFSQNRFGLKYLFFDPYKNPERTKPNLYSWRANNKFQLKNLIPAVSLYAGANFVFGDNPFYPQDPTVSPRVMLATQSQLTPKSVLIINLMYDRISTDFPELSYLISYSRALRNPKWSIFIENQGIDSDIYSDILLRAGASHLFSKQFQIDASIGGNFKNSPSRYFGNLGISYRWDFHKDDPIPIEDQDARGSGGPISKKAMKKKKKSTSLGPSKKERRKQRKKNKKKIKEIEDFES